MTTAKKTIHAKLMDARVAFHRLPLKKSGFNSFSKYHYFELADFLLPGMQCMGENDLLPVISFTDELATMTIHDVTTDASIVITSPMKEIDLKGSNAMQALGGCETYNSRYLWVAALQIFENDLLDAQPPAHHSDAPVKTTPAPPPAKKAAPATDADFASINEYVEAKQIPPKTLEWLKDETHWNNLTHSQALKVIKACKDFKPGE